MCVLRGPCERSSTGRLLQQVARACTKLHSILERARADPSWAQTKSFPEQQPTGGIIGLDRDREPRVASARPLTLARKGLRVAKARDLHAPPCSTEHPSPACTWTIACSLLSFWGQQHHIALSHQPRALPVLWAIQSPAPRHRLPCAPRAESQPCASQGLSGH